MTWGAAPARGLVASGCHLRLVLWGVEKTVTKHGVKGIRLGETTWAVGV